METHAFTEGPALRPIPQQRIREKLDELMDRQDYDGVGRLLTYWLREAEAGHDLRGQLMIRNEMIGHYRKTRSEAAAMESITAALDLIRALSMEGTFSAATTFVNAGTALNSFGRDREALPLFEQALEIYKGAPETAPELLGGLYNNMGLTLAALGHFSDAYVAYSEARRFIRGTKYGALEEAVTCLNEANAVEAQLGLEQGDEKIRALAEEAAALMDSPDMPRNGYYAYVCQTCIPTFEYYGFFLTAVTLRERMEAIYAGT